MTHHRATNQSPRHARHADAPPQPPAPSAGRWRLIVGGVGIAAFIALAAAVMIGAPAVDACDAWIQSVVFPLRVDGITTVLAVATDLSDTLVSVVVAAAFVGYLALRVSKRSAFVYASCVIAGEASVALAKLVVSRTRPIGMNLIEFPSDASFPSGHTFAAIAIVSFALFVLMRTHPKMPAAGKVLLGAIAVAWPVFIAFTRIYLAAHWPTDIIGSFLIGGLAYFPLATYAWTRLAEDAPREHEGHEGQHAGSDDVSEGPLASQNSRPRHGGSL